MVVVITLGSERRGAAASGVGCWPPTAGPWCRSSSSPRAAAAPFGGSASIVVLSEWPPSPVGRSVEGAVVARRHGRAFTRRSCRDRRLSTRLPGIEAPPGPHYDRCRGEEDRMGRVLPGQAGCLARRAVGGRRGGQGGSARSSPSSAPSTTSIGLKCGDREAADLWLERYPASVSKMAYIGQHGWNTFALDGIDPRRRGRRTGRHLVRPDRGQAAQEERPSPLGTDRVVEVLRGVVGSVSTATSRWCCCRRSMCPVARRSSWCRVWRGRRRCSAIRGPRRSAGRTPARSGSTWSTWTPRSVVATTPRSSPRSPRRCGCRSSCPAASATTTAWSGPCPPGAPG